jgi:hypothetical protein
LLKNKKGEPPRDTLALTVFTLHFLNLPQGDILTAADKHFGEPSSLPDRQILIWYKSFNFWLLGVLLKKGRVMHVFLQMSMYPLKHCGFLFRASVPEKPMNMSNKVTTTPQRETPTDEQVEQAT